MSKEESFSLKKEERERDKSPVKEKMTSQSPEEKVVITGDDILIEYVKRLTLAVKMSVELNKVY